MPFHIATFQDIKSGKTTDVYFDRTTEILKKKKINKSAIAEMRLKSFPNNNWEWGVLAGIEEVAELLSGLPVDVYSMPEGTVFKTDEPVIVLDGKYIDYSIYETSLLGLVCQASGIATKTAYSKMAAGEKPLISFGARRMHPAIAPMIERNAFIGGCDGVSVLKSAELIKEPPIGTIPHALILLMEDTIEALKAFHEIIPANVKRVALIDTFNDEKFEAVRAAEALGKDLYAVRIDTPHSRRGDMLEILKEVRWELDLRGFNKVKLFVSGGLDEEEIKRLRPYADAYGVGTSISNASVLDFSFDIVEIEEKPISKRGKESGSKQVYSCRKCFYRVVLPFKKAPPKCRCGNKLDPLLKPLLKRGKLVKKLPKAKEIREYVLKQVGRLKQHH